MEEVIQITVSICITVFVGFGVGWFLRLATTRMEPPAPKGIGDEEWIKIYKPGKDQSIISGTAWLGLLERLVFLAGFWLGKPAIIAGWLGFKVAAKWEVWKNVIQVPSALGESEVSYLQTRTAWGSWLFVRFLVGTLANILIALVALYIGQHWCEIAGTLCSASRSG